jgi:hypothetical protein
VLVSAIIGGLVTAIFIFVAMSGLEDGSDDVTIKEAPLPEKASSETVFDNDMSSSVREVYARGGTYGNARGTRRRTKGPCPPQQH